MFLEELNQSNFPYFAQFHPEQLWSEIDQETQNQAKKLSQSYSFYPLISHRLYLNYVACSCLIKEIEQQVNNEELEIEITSTLPMEQDLNLAILSFINGSSLDVEIKSNNKTFKKRLILMPIDYSESGEVFSIPEEWVNIEGWRGHYYLFIHIEPEENWLRVCGFTSQTQLKEKADYNPYNHKYEVFPDNLIDDFSILLLSLELTPKAKQQSSSEEHLLSSSDVITQNSQQTFNEEEANAILSKARNYAFYPPRMSMDFEQWLRFIQQPNQLETLFQKVTNSDGIVARALEQAITENQSKCDHILQECNQFLTTQYKTFRELIKDLSKPFQNKGYAPYENRQQLVTLLNKVLFGQTNPDSLLGATRGDLAEPVVPVESIVKEIDELMRDTFEKYWDIETWLDDGIPDCVPNWQKIDIDPSAPRFEKELVIHQQNYILKLICLNRDDNQWRFQLEHQEKHPIPEGMKLILLTDNLEPLEEKASSESSDVLNIDVTVEQGQALVWKTEPLPDNYESEPLYF